MPAFTQAGESMPQIESGSESAVCRYRHSSGCSPFMCPDSLAPLQLSMASSVS